jgi:catechol 2,3-dioxygenase-like lactoylglutathione lyase family enzyme
MRGNSRSSTMRRKTEEAAAPSVAYPAWGERSYEGWRHRGCLVINTGANLVEYISADSMDARRIFMSVVPEKGEDVGSWPKGIGAITLFVEDMEAAKQFYREVFGLPVTFEEDNSAVFDFGNTIINLLDVSEAPGLIEPAVVARHEAGSRVQFTIQVDDVDAMCAELATRGAELLNGPMDRPWGIRTASFRDPGGHIWEIAR